MSKKQQKDGYATVRLPQEFVDEIDKRIDRRFGYTSRADIIKAAMRDFFEKQETLKSQLPKLPRFGHFNVSEFGARITDQESELMAELYFKPEGVWCDLDKTFRCEHINYALKVPKIRGILLDLKRKKGWKIEIPDI